MPRPLPSVASAALCGWLATACTSTPIQTISTRLEPTVINYARTLGAPELNNSCTPAMPPAPPMPDDWWSGLPIAQTPKLPGQGVVGFNLWRNLAGTCRAFRLDVYRSAAYYDLSSVQNLRGLIKQARLVVHAAVLRGTASSLPCRTHSGGAGALLQQRPPISMPPSTFSFLGTDVGPLGPPGGNNAQPFPDGVVLLAFPASLQQPVSANGVTLSIGSGQMAMLEVDLTDRLNGALNRGDTSLGLMLSSSQEARPASPPGDQLDCRSTYQFQALEIEHY